MCHLIFFLPVFGLPVFWIFPFKTALVIYLIICAVSLLLYYKVFQALHRRVCTGRKAMLGKTAVVIRNIDPEGKIQVSADHFDHGKRDVVLLFGRTAELLHTLND